MTREGVSSITAAEATGRRANSPVRPTGRPARLPLLEVVVSRYSIQAARIGAAAGTSNDEAPISELKYFPKTTFGSPSGWAGSLDVPEEPQTIDVAWHTTDKQSAIQFNKELKGFKIKVKKQDTSYSTCHFIAIDIWGNQFTGQVVPIPEETEGSDSSFD